MTLQSVLGGVGFLGLVAMANAASAGEVLHLRAGRIVAPDFSQKIFAESLGKSDERNARYFVIQFRDHATEELKAQLAGLGIEPKKYLPDDAFLVKAAPGDIGVVGMSVTGIRAVVPFQAEWKVSPELLAGASKKSDSAESLMITLTDAADLATVRARLRQIRGLELQYAKGTDVVAVSRGADLAQIAAVEGVEWIEELPLVVPLDFVMSESDSEVPTTPPPVSGYESGTKLLNFDAAWKRGFTGSSQIGGMADTGVDTGNLSTLHPDLSGVIKGYAMGIGGTSWEDPQAHGTHVAGSVVGNGRSSPNGVLKGGAHDAKLVAVGMWSPLLNNISVNPDFNKLFGTPFKDGARVHTNSWGNPSANGAYDAMAVKADQYMWANPDMLVVFAAGNNGQDLDKNGRIDEGSVLSPGTAKNVLTVGASENLLSEGGIQKPHGQLRDGDKKWGVEPLASDTLSNNENGIAAFSSRGPTRDGRIKPDVVAPGTNIVSTRSKNPKATQLWGIYDENYLYSGGTSMATPIVAGAALVARDFLVRDRKIEEPSAALVKATLIHTAKDLYPGQYGTGPKQELPTRRPNVHEGYGRVDMDKATAFSSETTIIDEKSGVKVAEERSTAISLSEGENVRVTLAYTDAPGSAAAAKALVNDLDVALVGPGGAVVATKADRVNNVEMLEAAHLARGQYQVVVKGVNVPNGRSGRQPYALLITRY